MLLLTLRSRTRRWTDLATPILHHTPKSTSKEKIQEYPYIRDPLKMKKYPHRVPNYFDRELTLNPQL